MNLLGMLLRRFRTGAVQGQISRSESRRGLVVVDWKGEGCSHCVGGGGKSSTDCNSEAIDIVTKTLLIMKNCGYARSAYV
jgi:hypothetical protein